MEIEKDTQTGQDSAWVHEVASHPDYRAWEDAVMSKRVTSTSSSLSSVPGNPHICVPCTLQLTRLLTHPGQH